LNSQVEDRFECWSTFRLNHYSQFVVVASRRYFVVGDSAGGALSTSEIREAFEVFQSFDVVRGVRLKSALNSATFKKKKLHCGRIVSCGPRYVEHAQTTNVEGRHVKVYAILPV